MARTVGKVKSISGKAAVKTLNDQLHVLKVGEPLHENEMVYALGADSKVTLTLEGGRELTLNGYDEILLDKSVFTALEEGEALDVKALQQALAEALNPENMEETAAGQEVVGDANAGAEYADRNDARGNPSSYLTGTENNALNVTFDEVQKGNIAPIAFDDNGNAVEEGSGDDYDAPVVATGNVLDNDTDDSLPNPPSDLDVSAVSSNDTVNSSNYVGGFFIIEGKYGTLIINAETGEYTYTVNDSNADVNALNIGDSLSESFNYVVTDGVLTDDAILTLTINGSNDAPVAVGDRNYVKEAGYHQHPSMAEGNVITDPESGDSDVDNESIWVVGVQKVSGQGGHGGEGEENESGHSGGQGGHGGEGEENEGGHSGGQGGHDGEGEGGYGPGGSHAPTGYDFLVNGKYGVLFMWENGDYVYMLKNGKAQVDSLNEGDKVSETFSYTITDGDKYTTAELTISIQGTNDAPVAVADEVSISEDDFQPIWFWHPALTINALGNDTDVDSNDNPSNFNLLSVSVEGGIENGIAWIDQNTDTIKYIPNWWGNQSLNEGDTKNITLNYTMSDDSGVTSTSTVTITIRGENDFAIIYGDDDGKVIEDWHVTSSGKLYESGHLFVSDVDEGEEKFNTNVVANPNNIGGNLTIDQYGHWTYSIDNSLLQHLNEGAKVYEYFTVASLDGTDSETIKITITGTNDYATISGDSQGGVTEDVVGAYNKLYDSGKLNISDVDDGEAKFNTHVTANSHNIGGQLTISQNGSWNYSISNSLVQHLSAGEKVYEYFTVKSLDGTDSQTIQITITGTNDIATIWGDSQGGVTEDYHVSSSGKLTESSHLHVSDADDGEARFNTNVIANPNNVGGSLTIDQYGNWNYSINNSLIQHLSAGEKVYEYFTVKSLDGTDSEVIKITITGTNDIATISGDSQGGVTEDWHVSSSGKLTESGHLDVSDVDDGEARFNTNVIANPQNLGGELTIDQYGNWNYSISNSLVQYLNGGEKAYEYFTVKSLDGTDNEVIKITITGTNDGPVAIDDITVANYTTYTINLNSGSDWNQIDITPIGTEESEIYYNPGKGKIGIQSTESPDAKLIDNQGTNEGIKFEFHKMLQYVEVKFESWNSGPDSLTWKAMLGSSLVSSGTFTGDPHDMLTVNTGINIFDTLILQTSEGQNMSFYIDSINGYGIDIDSDLTVTENNAILIPESYMISNDTGTGLNITGIDSSGTIGVVSIDANGNVTYDPAGRFDHLENGELTTDRFTYTLTDGNGLTDTATVTVNIIGSEGSADDINTIKLSDILKSNFNDYNGGEGYDTVILDGKGTDIDFNKISSNLENIEHLDLNDNTNTSITLINITPDKVAGMTDEDNYLRISGDSNDTVKLHDFTEDSATSANLDGYDAYVGIHNGAEVTLHIESDIHVDIIP